MSTIETQTPSQPHEEEFNHEIDIDLEMVNTASRRIVEDQYEPSQDEDAKQKKAHNIAIGAALLVSAGTGVVGLANANEVPIEYSQETKIHTVEDNEGTLSIVDSIPGSSTVDRMAVKNHIESDPNNSDVYSNGLQVGERVSIPVSINGAESETKE